MNLKHRGKVNDLLDCYTDKNCIGSYAQVLDNGKIHLTGYISIENLKDIMTILKVLEVE
jgi:hypothetical protein